MGALNAYADMVDALAPGEASENEIRVSKDEIARARVYLFASADETVFAVDGAAAEAIEAAQFYMMISCACVRVRVRVRARARRQRDG